MAKSGLGESLPLAADLSVNPNWRIYGFEREGINYYQVNDLAGQVVLIIANVDATFWTLPAGKRPARVSLPAHRLALPAKVIRRVVFRNAEFSLAVHGDGADAVWVIEPSGKAG